MFSTPLILYFLIFNCAFFPTLFKAIVYFGGFSDWEQYASVYGIIVGIIMTYITYGLLLYLAKRNDIKRKQQQEDSENTRLKD